MCMEISARENIPGFMLLSFLLFKVSKALEMCSQEKHGQCEASVCEGLCKPSDQPTVLNTSLTHRQCH